MPAPAVGGLSSLGFGGRFGVIVGAQPLGEARDGRQLYALKVKATETVQAPKNGGSAAGAAPGPAEARAVPAPGQSARAPEAARSYADLSDGEKAAVDRLRQRDQQVKQEEKAHAAAAGDLAGPISYVYQRGPDGQLYAVGGSVPIKAQSLSGDPNDAEALGGRIAAAAHAATNPSGADLAAARSGYGMQGQAERAAQRAYAASSAPAETTRQDPGSLLDLSA